MKEWAPVVKALTAVFGGVFTLGGSIYAGFWIGTYLDERLESFGFGVAGILLGIVSGLWQMYRLIIAVFRE